MDVDVIYGAERRNRPGDIGLNVTGGWLTNALKDGTTVPEASP